jgi:hypothetical protein
MGKAKISFSKYRQELGSLGSLNTNLKSNIVTALNEVNEKADNNATLIAGEVVNRQSAITTETNRAIAEETALSARISAREGLGGYLTHNNFGSATPTQEDLTNYALEQIGITDPLEIFNNTRIENDFDGQTWVLINTPNTEPAVFVWEAMSGNSGVSQFTDSSAGVILGSTSDGEIGSQASGKGRVIGWDDLKNRVSVVEGKATKVEESDVNGCIKINDQQVIVYNETEITEAAYLALTPEERNTNDYLII